MGRPRRPPLEGQDRRIDHAAVTDLDRSAQRLVGVPTGGAFEHSPQERALPYAPALVCPMARQYIAPCRFSHCAGSAHRWTVSPHEIRPLQTVVLPELLAAVGQHRLRETPTTAGTSRAAVAAVPVHGIVARGLAGGQRLAAAGALGRRPAQAHAGVVALFQPASAISEGSACPRQTAQGSGVLDAGLPLLAVDVAGSQSS